MIQNINSRNQNNGAVKKIERSIIGDTNASIGIK